MNADEPARFRCLMFRGGRDNTVGDGGKRDARDLLRLMADPIFDPVRERREFAQAARKAGEILNEG